MLKPFVIDHYSGILILSRYFSERAWELRDNLRIQSRRLNDLRNDKLHQCFTNQQTEIRMIEIDPQAPVAQQLADEVFDVSKVKESSFFLIGPHWLPPQIFDADLLENTDLSPSRFQWVSYHDHVLSQMVL